ncbi:MAG: ribonuclease D [Rickettsiaceae bacterium]|nr:ribonuclease D [Rickettsiaceae bacterium]
MILIDNQEEFEKVCNQLSEEKVICIDTEFCRRRTYYAVLSLIQLSTNNHKIIIDVLSGINISSFAKLLNNKEICKIFHAPDQDLDIFLHLFKKLPSNIFDTQIAASILGFGDMKSYSSLCKDVLNINLDKTLQKADWLVRPLDANLLNYAIKDVEYLMPLYINFSNTIKSRNLWANYQERLKKLLSPENYKLNLEKIYRKAGIMDQSESVLRNFSYFVLLREECAQKFDVPRGYCASEAQLIKFNQTLPINDQDLARALIERPYLVRAPYKTKLFELCKGLREEKNLLSF